MSFFLCCGALLLVFLWYGFRPVLSWRYRSIPGPPGLPFIGNLHVLLKHGTAKLTPGYKAKYGPVFKIWIGARPVVMVTDPDLGRSIMYRNINRMRFLTRPLPLDQHGIVQARDEEWKMLRNAWLPAFHPDSISRYTVLMDACALELAQQLVKASETGEVIDIWRQLGSMTLQVVGSTAYGVDFHTLDKAHGSVEGNALEEACAVQFRMSRLASGSLYTFLVVIFPELKPFLYKLASMFPDQPMRALTQAGETIVNVSKYLIHTWKDDRSKGYKENGNIKSLKQNGKKGVQPGSFLGLLLEDTESKKLGKLDDVQVAAQAATFILAGYETTANALAFTLYHLATNPIAESRLLEEIDSLSTGSKAPQDWSKFLYAHAVILESLRLHPPAPSIARELKEPITWNSVVIPARAGVIVSLNALHHDPEIWPDAEKFLPERFLPGFEYLGASKPHAYCPFGGGVRKCIGNKFALQEAVIALVRLSQQFTFRLVEGQVPLETVQGITVSPKNGVKVVVQKRH